MHPVRFELLAKDLQQDVYTYLKIVPPECELLPKSQFRLILTIKLEHIGKGIWILLLKFIPLFKVKKVGLATMEGIEIHLYLRT